jgi:excisionase family DNA binding protein
MMTVPEVAEHLRCSEWAVRTLARSGALRGSLVSGRWLFRLEDVEEYVDEQANRPVVRRRRRRAS